MASEKSPLLSNQGDSSPTQYGENSDDVQEERQATYVTVPPIGPDELPPPYSPSPHGVPMIPCKVCGFMIDITGRRDQHVVKCSSCNEATPIKSAPPGKKYVRCPCQCLLICKSSSQRISCPRNNCKRILNVAPLPVNPIPPTVPGMCQVSCAHCHRVFLFNTLMNVLARCPHCRKVSSVGPQYARSRGIMYLIAALLQLAIAFAVTFGTLYMKYEALYALDTCLFILFLLLLYKAIYHFTMKVSRIEGPI